MTYLIKFTSGEKTGEHFPLGENESLSIGRSHTNAICFKTPDISGKHVILRGNGAEGISLEILSARTTRINGTNGKIGEVRNLTVGDSVQMGGETVFVIAEDVDSTPAAAGGDNDKTRLPGDERMRIVNSTSAVATKPEAVNETIAFKTRIASEEELDKIKGSYKWKARLRFLFVSIPVALFFTGAIALYFYLKPVAEEHLTWPKDAGGKRLTDYKVVVPYLAVAFPAVPGHDISSAENGLVIRTKIGKHRDVPLCITAMSTEDKNTLTNGHAEAFASWMGVMREKDPTVNWSGDKNTLFVNTHRGSGVPMSIVSYTRRVGNDDFYGFAVFVRHAENTHAVLAEVPLKDRWRARRFFLQETANMVIFAVGRTLDHWEGASQYRAGSAIGTDLKEAENFLKREAPAYWGKIFYRIQSALVKGTLSGEEESVKTAKSLLVKLRNQQTVWFNAQKLAYQYAEKNGDRRTKESIQATCESVFSSEFQQSDYRYDLIKRKDWK